MDTKRPFLIDVEGRNQTPAASAVRCEQKPGASALRLMGEQKPEASAVRLTQESKPGVSGEKEEGRVITYEDLWRHVSLTRSNDQHGDSDGSSVAVYADQPLFTRLAEITRCLCLNIDLELSRSERREASGESNPGQGASALRVTEEQKPGASALRLMEDQKPEGSALRLMAERILASRSRVGIASSGTTGKPKWVFHRMDTLGRSVKVSPKHREDVWGLAYSPDRFAGMQVFLQAICNLNTIVSLLGLSPDQIHEAIEQHSITHLSATPTLYRLLISGATRHEGVRSVTIGGEVCDPSLIAELRERFPNAKFRNIYASTESGSLFESNADTFIVPSNLQDKVRVCNGQLWLHESMIAESLREGVTDGFFPTGDEVEVVHDNPLTLRVLARRSDWINVGGTKVNPHSVESALLKIDGVVEARVFAQKNSVVGQIVCAELVLSNSVQYSVADIRRILSPQLDSYAIPRIIQFVDAIGISPSGKKGRTT